MKHFQMSFYVAIACVLQSLYVHAEHHKAATTIDVVPVAKSIHMLMAKGGGNMGLLIGEDGTFLIDDHFAPLTPKLLATIKSLGGDTPKFLINTHYHGDHSGGNINLGKAGSLIVAHDNVREILTTGYYVKPFNMKQGPLASEGLPLITFSEEISFHINNDTVKVFHLSDAHTNGDAVIYFEQANVLHTGDIFFNGIYPFIDIEHGGSLKGMIAAVDQLLELIDEKTKVIPGHGALANKADLRRYRKMLSVAYDRFVELKEANLTIEEVVAKKPLADLAGTWGKGFFKTDQWVALVYGSVK
jgi:glyoxylase-like metal-dependent hydrolase (beta-lactamase superfamily II)